MPCYSIEDAVKVLLHTPAKSICTQQPIGCSSSKTFVVDLSKLDHRDDIRSDDLGVWKNQGVKSSYCSVKFQNDDVQRVRVLENKPAVMRYRLKCTYWSHAEDKRIFRRLFELEGEPNSFISIIIIFNLLDYNEKLYSICILQYCYPENCTITGQPHCNSKGKSLYNRSKKSTLDRIKVNL